MYIYLYKCIHYPWADLLDLKASVLQHWVSPPTVLSAAHTVQGAGGNGNDFLPLQPLDLPRSSNMVIRSMAQPVIVTFAPAQKKTSNYECEALLSCPTLLA